MVTITPCGVISFYRQRLEIARGGGHLLILTEPPSHKAMDYSFIKTECFVFPDRPAALQSESVIGMRETREQTGGYQVTVAVRWAF